MKRIGIIITIVLALCLMLSACTGNTPEKTDAPQTESNAVATDTAQKTNEEETDTPEWMKLEGEWILGSGVIDGEEYTAEDAGYTTEITFEKNGDGLKAHYFRELNGLRQEFDAELEILDEPVYEGCGNEEWSATFKVADGTFEDDDEFYMTLIDGDKLLLKHIYIIDHFDDSMYMSYCFYDRK